MKNFKVLLAVVMTALLASAPAFAFNESERAAQRTFSDYLKSKGIASKIDDKDNSVNFYKGKTFYWVTFEGGATGILYTLHRAPLNMDVKGASKEETSRRLENATRAANYMNINNEFKTCVKGTKVEFSFPVYASSATEYTKMFDRILRNFDNAKEYYDQCHKKAKVYNDSVHQYWMKNDTAYKVVPQKTVRQNTSSVPSVFISKVAFRNVDEVGNEITGYNDNIRKSNVKFIQPRIEAKADKKGIYRLATRIKTPKGKILVPDRDSKMTTSTTVEVGKGLDEIELDVFGINDGSIWEAGEYGVVFYVDGKQVATDSFTIL